MDFTWNLLSSLDYNDEFWIYGFTGTNTLDPVNWDFYRSLVTFGQSLPNPYNGNSLTIAWSAYLRLFDIDQTPTLYQGVLPKYKFGTWAKSYAGLVFEDGFINYQYQRLTSGIFSTEQELYTPYGSSDPFFPTTGVANAGVLAYPFLGDVDGFFDNRNYGDAIYTQVNVPAFQELFLYATIVWVETGADAVTTILL